ncbi:MAG: 8-amino-7-oxononanoate synthase [Candidatus Omnitrophica bacterium]|nr:8-amino-7-oxononanoate synthase [Candidatus Omnitrophota bacterium]
MKAFLDETLDQLADRDLLRQMRTIDGSQSRQLRIDGRDVLNFCSNNYLGLADDARLTQAAMESLRIDGFGCGASRLVCGNMSSHARLEKAMAEFKATESCVLFNSGYTANIGIISSLLGRGDMIFSDKLNHASIIDGILLSGAQYKRYAHANMGSLEALLKAAAPLSKKLIVTDSVFSMDGDIAPLPEIVALAKKYDCAIMVDEAHALGVLGQHGKGAVEHFGLEGQIDIQMGTFSKAVGSFGAYCCGSKQLVEFLRNKARSFIYTTGLPPSVAAASLRGLEIIVQQPERRKELLAKTQFVSQALNHLGFDTLNTQTPIIPIVVKDTALSLSFSRKLFEAGIFVSAIRPPTVPANTARLRVTVMAIHTQQDLELLLKHVERIGKELCLI